MTLEVFAANFVDALTFQTMIAWAELLKIDHFDIMGDPLDDELPDQEDKLRVAVVEAILQVGKKPEKEPLGKTMADCFDKLLSKDPKNPMPLGGK